MNISIENKKFIEAVSTAVKFSEKKGGVGNAISSLLILANDDGIKMRATNLEIGIDLSIEGKVLSKGAVAVPSSVIGQIAGTISGEGTINIENTGDILTIKERSGKSSLKTVPYEDFPSIPFPESSKNRIVVSGLNIKNILNTVSSCAATTTIRPELASIYISIEGGILTTAATDSFRLVERKTPLSSKGTQGKFLIPAKNSLEIARSLPDEDIILSFDEHQCAFIFQHGTIVSRLTNAVYPDYHQIIPKESIVEATIIRKDFESALRRTAIFSDSYQKVSLHFDPKKNQVVISSNNPDIGESTETITARVHGGQLNLAFNHRYLSTVLNLTSAESLSIVSAGVGRPVVIRGVGDASLLYLVSPMNQ